MRKKKRKKSVRTRLRPGMEVRILETMRPHLSEDYQYLIGMDFIVERSDYSGYWQLKGDNGQIYQIQRKHLQPTSEARSILLKETAEYYHAMMEAKEGL